ncbi:MAG: hypothetical protein J7L61_03035 [Thermoplasmata archaeon]|nr:hypothetical protein [Thermoplasmata archaeon]
MRSLLLFLADAAARVIRDHVNSEESFQERGLGADGTPTEVIDHLAEEVILEELDTIGSDLNVLSEEAGFIDRGGDKTLVVDPLDGTYNSMRKTGPYAVSLAVGTSSTDDLEAAIVMDVVTGTTYMARRGLGAVRNHHPIRCRPYNREEAIFSIYLGREATPESHRLASRPRRVRYFGCVALELCFVASGFLDGYYVSSIHHQANVRVTDLAAGCLILREAGGELYNAGGERLRMSFDLGERSSVLAVGDRRALEDFT